MYQMKRKERMIKMEDPRMIQSRSSICSDDVFSRNSTVPAGMFDFGELGDYNYGKSSTSSLGFMELLGIQDFTTSCTPSIFDMLQVPPMGPTKSSSPTVVPESSEVLNTPATPNSSSISSESSGAANDEQINKVAVHVVDDHEQQQQNKTKKQNRLKVKKGGDSGNSTSRSEQQQKKQKAGKQRRVAFMTKSEVDHLEDGYRWRKYGQKAVKNSPFPRSYYRCTSSSCNVKKRVERCYSDPTIVVNTYEGQHTHPINSTSPSSSSFYQQKLQLHINNNINYLNSSSTTTTSTSTAAHLPPQLLVNQNNMINTNFIINFTPTCTINPTTTTTTTMHHDHHLHGPHGLLQDILPNLHHHASPH